MTRMINRRVVIGGATAASALAIAGMPQGGSAQQATPELPATGLGEAALRLHTSTTAEIAASLVERAAGEFAPQFALVEDYFGYLLAMIPAMPEQHFSVSLFATAEAAAGSTMAAAAFHEGLPAEFDDVATEVLPATIYIAERPDLGGGTPIPSDVPFDLAGGYVTVRIHPGKAGKDQRALAPVISEAFRVVLAGLPGFRAYIWCATADYRMSINIFDTEAAAAESNERSKTYVNQSLKDYTDGDSRVLIGAVEYADLPLLSDLA